MSPKIASQVQISPDFQRVAATLQNNEPDRVPLAEGSHPLPDHELVPGTTGSR